MYVTLIPPRSCMLAGYEVSCFKHRIAIAGIARPDSFKRGVASAYPFAEHLVQLPSETRQSGQAFFPHTFFPARA